jgi:hypothetical protein
MNRPEVGPNSFRGIAIGFGETAKAAMEKSKASMLEEEVGAVGSQFATLCYET